MLKPIVNQIVILIIRINHMENQNDNIHGAADSVEKGQKKEKPVDHGFEEEKENLGLDADQSSEDFTGYRDLNSDNDRISGNPDGEDDDNDHPETPRYSPLMDK